MSYIHGFDKVEQARLVSQAEALDFKVFEKIDFSGRKKILEVGSGVGAQTEILLNRYPNSHVTGIEVSESQNITAHSYLSTKFDSSRFELYLANAKEMPFDDNSFDAVYICWVLEHVSNPQKIIDECYRVLEPGGIIYITEVQNNNLWIIPKSALIIEYWNKYNQLQTEMGGDPFVGVQIGNYIKNAGFVNSQVYAQTFLFDNNDPKKRELMIDYWTDLMLSGFQKLLNHGKVKASDREKIISEMSVAKEENGVFHYAFIQTIGIKP